MHRAGQSRRAHSARSRESQATIPRFRAPLAGRSGIGEARMVVPVFLATAHFFEVAASRAAARGRLFFSVKRCIAAFSCSAKRFRRAIRSSKSTWWPSKSAVDAGELDLVAHLDPAAAAHPGAVDHDRVHAHHGLHLARAVASAACLHHDRRPDGHDFSQVWVFLQTDSRTVRDDAPYAFGAVVGAQDELVAHAPELVFPEDEAGCESRRYRSHRRRPACSAPADTWARRRGRRRRRRPSSPSDDARHAHRPDERVQPRSDLAGLLHLARGAADRLDHERDRSLARIEVGERERDALALGMRHDDDELPGPAALAISGWRISSMNVASESPPAPRFRTLPECPDSPCWRC